MAVKEENSVRGCCQADHNTTPRVLTCAALRMALAAAAKFSVTLDVTLSWASASLKPLML
eukprot:m.330841 g.330841  ORF g.330841 m.330841 type:complete len:60 (+) comp19768_c4_seq2:870-1049(+)